MLIGAVAICFWPGVPMYDTVAQYEQAVSGEVDDWHPPIMVRLWQVLHALGPGSGPMFLLQIALYALGFGLIVAALERNGRRYAGAAAALLALSPLILGWQMVVLKDGQMLAALIAAFGIISHYRMQGARVPTLAAAVVVVLVGYATLVRANALFATVPLCTFLSPRPRTLAARGGLAIAVILLLLTVQPPINHRLFGAGPSGIAKSQPLFDLAAIAAAVPGSVPPFTTAERSQLIARHCVKSFFWDPVGDPGACSPVAARAHALSEKDLYLDLARAAAMHPLAYFEHRLAHWNSTERWLVQPGLIGAGPPKEAEPNEDGLSAPSNGFVNAWQSSAAWLAGTPLGWPISWTAAALLLLPIAWRRRNETSGALAFALLVSALTLEASFLMISIASDLRYHLWPMTAVPLALIILPEPWRKMQRTALGAAALLAIVVAGGIVTRSTRPPAPNSYQGMIHAPL